MGKNILKIINLTKKVKIRHLFWDKGSIYTYLFIYIYIYACNVFVVENCEIFLEVLEWGEAGERHFEKGL